MEAFVEVMAGSILSSFDDVLSFFLQVIFTSENEILFIFSAVLN